MFLDGKETKVMSFQSLRELSMVVQGEVPMIPGVPPIREGLNLSLTSSFSHRMRVWCHLESGAIIIIISKKSQGPLSVLLCAERCRAGEAEGREIQGREALLWTQVLH